MKTLVKWFIKRYAKSAKVKELIHKGNASLATKEVGSRVSSIMGYSNDATALADVYLKAYSDDGKMSDEERAKCDAKCDELVDKYLSDEAIDALVDKLFG